jgi:hypothetical protein
MAESAMLAAECSLNLVDAMDLRAAVTNRCDLFITNNQGLNSTGSMEVVQLA